MLIKELLANFFIRTKPYLAYSDIIALGQRFSDSSYKEFQILRIKRIQVRLVFLNLGLN